MWQGALLLIFAVVIGIALNRAYNHLRLRRATVRKARRAYDGQYDTYLRILAGQDDLTRAYHDGDAASPYLQLLQHGAGPQAGGGPAMFSSVQNNAPLPNLGHSQLYAKSSEESARCLREVNASRNVLNNAVEDFNNFRNTFPTFVFAWILRIGEEAVEEVDVSGLKKKAVITDFRRGAPVLRPDLAHPAMPAPATNPALLSAAVPQAHPALPPGTATPAPAPGVAVPGWNQGHLTSSAGAAPSLTAGAARGGATEAFQAVPSVSLRFLSGPLAGHRLPVGGGAVIGREVGSAQIVVPDPQVSSRHAWVGMGAAGFVFVDRGSTNGSIVNGHPVPAQSEVPVKHGDVVTLGRANSVSFVIEMG